MRPLRPAPHAARRLLWSALPLIDRDDIAANLDDLHQAYARRHGQWRADIWYWRQALVVPVRLRVAGAVPVTSSLPPSLPTRTSIMRTIVQDLRYAYRQHRARPAFAAVAILSLAIAIGFNSAVFSIVDGVLLRPVPLADFERLVMVWETDRNTDTSREPGSVPDFVDYRRRVRGLELGALVAGEVNLTPANRDPVRLAGLGVSHELLPILGIHPLLGRAFTAEDELAGSAPVILISSSLWAQAFDRDPSVVGRTLVVDEQAVTVVGVVPDATDFGVFQILSAAAYSRSFADRGTEARVDIWAPLTTTVAEAQRATHPIFMVGRLSPTASVAEAQDELTAIAVDLEQTYPINTGRGVNVELLEDVVLGPIRPAFLALLGAVGLVLLVACVNVANLLLAQSEGRRREIAIRAALGAGARRLARQLLTESVALALVAGLVGVGVAFVVLMWLVANAPAGVPRLDTVTIDLRVLLVALGTSVLVGLTFGLVPMLQAGQSTSKHALASGSNRSTGGRGRTQFRGVLVVAELALAVMLVIGAGLLVKSFWHLQRIDAGFTAADVTKAEFQLPASRYPVNFAVWPDFQEIHAFNAGLLARALTLPGVESAAIAGNHPLDPGFTNSFSVVGRESEAATWPEISIRRVTSGYFDTVGLRLVRGRLLADSDTTLGPAVSVINVAAAERFFPDGDPIGHAINLWGTQRRIVGIVENVQFHGLTAAAPIAMYTPLPQTPGTNGAGVLLVRSASGGPGMSAALASAIRAVDPGLAVFGLETLDVALARSVSTQRFTMYLVGLFAVMALGLAALGVHGVLSYSVRQRTREIGIRIALGAQPERVRRLVMGEGLALTGTGLALGLVGALMVTRVFRTLLFGVTPTDPLTFAGVVGILGIVALVASYLPARWATRIDPNVALRVDR